MITLTAQIDRFVRWFFNSSPEAMVIEPRPCRPAPRPSRPLRDRRSNPSKQSVRVSA
jgi:hypothetical protein